MQKGSRGYKGSNITAGRKVTVSMTIEGLGGGASIGHGGSESRRRDKRTDITEIEQHGENCIFTGKMPGASGRIALSKTKDFIPGRYMSVAEADLDALAISRTKQLIRDGKLKIEGDELVGI
ncbi:MAG: hypothetical protein HGB37_02040 [Candidatus Moranbacteria bacterium]|nr:hypothetical protein [Candidatus Moranbacteria bacterium]